MIGPDQDWVDGQRHNAVAREAAQKIPPFDEQMRQRAHEAPFSTDEIGGMKHVGLGRIYAPDTRDRAYELTAERLRSIKPEQSKVRARPWDIGPILDQGATSQCTVYSFAQFLQSSPIKHTLAWASSVFTELYEAAQRIDGIRGPHDGSTERAVQTVAKDRGLVSEYLWATDEDIAREYLKTRGTLLFGSDWFSGMFSADEHGYVEPTGAPAGGHEYLLRWYYGPTHRTHPDTYEFVNSWGAEWGKAGHFYMKADTFKYLFTTLNGDLVSPIEVARKTK